MQKQYQIDQAKLNQEEEFFNKWLKQRENLGILGGGTEDKQPDETGRTLKDANSQMLKRKDAT